MEALADAAILGSFYSVLSLGLSLVWGTAGIIHLSLPAILIAGGYLAFIMCKFFPFGVALLFAVFGALVLGTAVYTFILRKLVNSELLLVVVGLLVAFVIEEVLILLFGSSPRRVPALTYGTVKILGAKVYKQGLIAFCGNLTLTFSFWFFGKFTSSGLKIRALASNAELAVCHGVEDEVARLTAITFATGLATFGALLVLPLTVVQPSSWHHPLIVSLSAVVLGGLNSIVGTCVSAFLLAAVEVAIVKSGASLAYLKSSGALFAMIVTLLVKPSGLFGREGIE